MTDELISRAAVIAVAERAELDWADPSWTLEQLRALPAAQVQPEPVARSKMAEAFTSALNKRLNEEIAAGAAEAGVTPKEYLRTAADMLRKLRATPPAPDDLDALVARAILKARFYDVEPEMYDHDEASFYAQVWDDHGEDALYEAAAAITALRARPATVQVKPLVWAEGPGGSFSEADTGTYRAFAPNGGDRFMWSRYSSWPRSGVILGMGGDLIENSFATLEAAKAAAQADYEARIRAALDEKGGA